MKQQQPVIDSDNSDTEIEPVIKTSESKSKKQKVKVISTKSENPFESLMNNTLKLF